MSKTVCRRRICGADTDDKAFCSERCERLHSPPRRPRTPADREAADHRAARDRATVINNSRVGR